MFGIKEFTAIINPPQSSILAVGSTSARLVPLTDCATDEGDFERVSDMVVNLCCDRRVVEESHAAQWLQEFKQVLEDPNLLLG
jgi:pyruvate dehydrogenase E2 component (dihydrolipoamide acetyltransferase)